MLRSVCTTAPGKAVGREVPRLRDGTKSCRACVKGKSKGSLRNLVRSGKMSEKLDGDKSNKIYLKGES